MTDELTDLTFPVEKVAVMGLVDENLVHSTKRGITHAIKNMDTLEILAFVSGDYALIKNADIISSFEKFFTEKKIRTELQASAFNDVRFRMTFALMDYSREIQNGDSVYPIFFVQNSYNRSQKYQFGISVSRGVCANVLTAWGVDVRNLDMLHTPGAGDGIAVEESLKLIQEFLPAFEETLEPYHELAERTMEVGSMATRIAEVVENTKFPIGLAEDANNQAITEVLKYGWEPSDWIVYNAMNFQLNHNAENLLGRKADTVDRQVLTHLMKY